ncbi:MAG: hypothetical protein NC089_03790 [Bacteroides sp.]|nr:hypothetical protein [Bacteroides sp.]MCM1549712.1 hypothetical protein [Clostridium sp.]
MKQKIKTNLLISSVAMMAALMTMIYLVATMPNRIELIIAFGLIVVTDTYFLVDSIIRKIDEITNRSLDKQNELTKVEKGIYSVAKREELSMNQKLEELINAVAELQTDNIRLNNELIEQQKLCTKLIMKKNQENMVRVVNSNDRITKQVVQLSGDNKIAVAEANETLHNIHQSLEGEISHSKITRMPS